jgi:hypothetical protein
VETVVVDAQMMGNLVQDRTADLGFQLISLEAELEMRLPEHDDAIGERTPIVRRSFEE